MSNEHSKIFDLIVEKLENYKFDKAIKGEPHLQKVLLPILQQVLNENNLSEYNLRTQRLEQNPNKGECPKIYMLGRSYWPDIAVLKGKDPIIGLELKVSNRETELDFNTRKMTNAIKEAVGQCIIYRSKYQYCIAYIKTTEVGEKKSVDATKNNENDKEFYEVLDNNKIKLIITSGM